jgi:small subunit ribosomal protein S20
MLPAAVWWTAGLIADYTSSFPPYEGSSSLMANIPSQIKRNRQNERRRVRNKSVRSALKTYMKKFHVAVESGDRESATEAYRTAARKLDKAAQNGIVHRNFAANHKSKMARRLNLL